jgi:hypothetical protein
MIDFTEAAGVLMAEGHDHDDDDVRAALTARAGVRADTANLSETWYSEDGGFAHDCAAHQDLDKALWSPHCGTFRPVTVATGIPAPGKVERAAKVDGR